MPMINEAIFCLHEGVATAESIDTVMKLGMAHPMGPLALADFIGLDVCLAILEVLHSDLGDDKYRPCPLLRRMVMAGHLGRKRRSTGFLLVLGMNFDLTEEQDRDPGPRPRFRQWDLRTHGAAERDRNETFPTEQIRKAGELGLMGLLVPEEYGGAGPSNVALSAARSIEINAVDASVGVTLSVHNSLVCRCVNAWADDELKAKYLPKLASGEWLGAYALSETEAGSDAGSLTVPRGSRRRRLRPDGIEGVDHER